MYLAIILTASSIEYSTATKISRHHHQTKTASIKEGWLDCACIYGTPEEVILLAHSRGLCQKIYTEGMYGDVTLTIIADVFLIYPFGYFIFVLILDIALHRVVLIAVDSRPSALTTSLIHV